MNDFVPLVSLYQNAAQADDFKSPFFCRSVGQRIADENFRSKFTSHYFYEFIWTVDGQGIFELEDGTKYHLLPGTFFIAPPHTKRVMYTDGKFWSYRWFSAVGELFDGIVRGFDFDYLVSMQCDSLEYYFAQLVLALKNYSRNRSKDAGSIVYNIFTKVSCESSSQDKSVFAKSIVSLIDENIFRPELNIDWISERLKCNRSHLSRVFKSELGEAPSEYLLKRRLLLAMESLKNRNDKISVIAAACGFTDSDYFSRFFKRRTGLPPSKFRQQEQI